MRPQAARSGSVQVYPEEQSGDDAEHCEDREDGHKDESSTKGDGGVLAGGWLGGGLGHDEGAQDAEEDFEETHSISPGLERYVAEGDQAIKDSGTQRGKRILIVFDRGQGGEIEG